VTSDIRDVLRSAAPTRRGTGGFDEIWQRSRKLRARRAAVAGATLVVFLGLGAVTVGRLDEARDAGDRARRVAPAGVAGGTWRAIPAAPIEGRIDSIAVWTGEEQFVWGGYGRPTNTGLLDGALFNPSTGEWRRVTLSPLRTGLAREAVWTGTEAIIWGGENSDDPTRPDHGAAYNPTTDSWRQLSPAPDWSLAGHSLVWTGEEMIVWGGVDMGRAALLYDPVEDEWRVGSRAPIGSRHSHVAVWTGDEMIVWGGEPRVPRPVHDGAAYDPETDSWRLLPDGGIRRRANASAVWTGKEMIVLGGTERRSDYLSDGVAFDPSSNLWRQIPDAPSGGYGESVVWTGSEMIASGGRTGPVRMPPTSSGLFAAYAPTRNEWATLPPPPRPTSRPSVVWTGRALIVWGGWDTSIGGVRADGAVFLP
jgi:hypothetical protein